MSGPRFPSTSDDLRSWSDENKRRWRKWIGVVAVSAMIGGGIGYYFGVTRHQSAEELRWYGAYSRAVDEMVDSNDKCVKSLLDEDKRCLEHMERLSKTIDTLEARASHGK